MSEATRRASAVAAYRAGSTSYEIATRFGVNPATVRRWVEQVETLRRTGPRGRADVPSSLIVELRDVEQLSWSAVAAEVGMSKTGVITRYRIATEGARRDRSSPPAQKADNYEHRPPGRAATGRGGRRRTTTG